MNQHLREHAARNLAALVVSAEFTLISVMVGVILFPLMDFATPILRELKFEYMLYIASGLLLILYLWTQVIAHSLSFVGWPIDLLHNLLYIVFATVLAIQMHFLQDPQGWFALTFLTAVVAVIIAWYDNRLILARLAASDSVAASVVYQGALTRQQFSLRLSPLLLANAVLQAALVYFFPVIFLEYRGHLVLIFIQAAAFAFLTARTISDFKGDHEKILAKAADELAGEERAA